MRNLILLCVTLACGGDAGDPQTHDPAIELFSIAPGSNGSAPHAECGHDLVVTDPVPITADPASAAKLAEIAMTALSAGRGSILLRSVCHARLVPLSGDFGGSTPVTLAPGFTGIVNVLPQPAAVVVAERDAVAHARAALMVRPGHVVALVLR